MNTLHRINKRPVIPALAFITSCYCSTTCLAQTPEADKNIERIGVTGVRASMAKALDLKRDSDSIVDSLVAQDINDFPDLNITEALQRISGVTITRREGEGQQVTVRGLAPQFTRVTLNGQTVTSGNGRDVDLDIFASELFREVRLQKAPEANITEGGLAATIDMRTARPFDYEGFTQAASLQAVNNNLAGKTDPRATYLISNTWDDVGALFSIAYSGVNLRADSAENNRFQLRDFEEKTQGKFKKLEMAGLPRSIIELRERKRIGATLAFQYQPQHSPHSFNMDFAYAKFDEFRSRYSIDGLTLAGGIVPVSVTTAPNSVYVTQGIFDNVTSRTENVYDDVKDTLTIGNLEHLWQWSQDTQIKTTLGYSRATNTPDLFRVLYAFNGRFEFKNAEIDGQVFPVYNSHAHSFNDLKAYTFNQSRFIDIHVKDQETSFKIDVTHDFDDNWFSSFDSGFRYAKRRNKKVEYDGRINPSQVETPPSLSDVGVMHDYGFFAGQGPDTMVRDFPIVPFENFADNAEIFPPDFRPSFDAPASFGITETSLAAYGQLNIDSDVLNNHPIRGNLGVRLVRTFQTSNGYTTSGKNVTPLEVKQAYTDILPSLNLSVDLTDDLLLRFAASKGITRPTLNKLSPGQNIYPTTLRVKKGNPLLEPFRVTQFDLGFEWYFADESNLSATLFYKKLDSFIETVSRSGKVKIPAIYNDDGENVQNEAFEIREPINGQGASVKGLELSYQQPFSFLPDPFDGLGLAMNITFARSAQELNFNGNTFSGPFYGQSKLSYNLVPYYEKGPFSLRLAYSWRDDFLRAVRGGNRRNEYEAARGQLDMSVQYQLTDNVTLLLDALNLLQEETYFYAETYDRGLELKETGRFLFAGVRASF